MNLPTKRQLELPFSARNFALTVVLTLVVYFAAFGLVAPSLWKSTIAIPLWKLGIVFGFAHLVASKVEYFFHRYVFHACVVPLLRYFHNQHVEHHMLTNVKLISIRGQTGKVFNRFPIVEKRQYEAAYFPWYSLGAFFVVSLLVTIPLQSLLPTWPILIGVPLSITLSLILYESIHWMEHLPFETFWHPKVTGKRFGRFWTAFYCFHFRHHADVGINLAVGGFFGLPIWDWLFGTYAPWWRVWSHGETVYTSDFEAGLRRPGLIIRLLDKFLIRSM